MKIRHGWYSGEDARARHDDPGTLPSPPLRYACIYATPSGKRVMVTDVTDTADRPTRKWNDLRYVGDVTHCLRDATGQWQVIDDVQMGPEDPK